MNVIFTFYRNFIWPANLVTLVSCYLMLGGSGKNAVYMFWMKLITGFFFGVFFEFFHAQQFCFYNNLGYSKTRLFTTAAILDLFIWSVLTVIVLLI